MMESATVMYGLVLAGGTGTRLWPVSTRQTPKQFVAFDARRTLLQRTLDLLKSLMPVSRVYVATFPRYEDLVRSQIPDLPVDNVILEPSGSGTAFAVGVVAAILRAMDPEAVIVCTAADLYFADTELYCRALEFGADLALQDQLVLIGITPSSPEPGYGYIRIGEPLASGPADLQAFNAIEYVSKPSRELAESYIQQGTNVWHSGVSLWRADRVLRDIARSQPEIGDAIARITERIRDIGFPAASEELSAIGHAITIESAILQGADDLVTIPLSTGWSDLGTWDRVASQFATDANDNRFQLSSLGSLFTAEARGNVIYSTTSHAIAVLGAEDLIVVLTDGALLIARKDMAGNVGDLMGEMRQAPGDSQ